MGCVVLRQLVVGAADACFVGEDYGGDWVRFIEVVHSEGLAVPLIEWIILYGKLQSCELTW